MKTFLMLYVLFFQIIDANPPKQESVQASDKTPCTYNSECKYAPFGATWVYDLPKEIRNKQIALAKDEVMYYFDTHQSAKEKMSAVNCATYELSLKLSNGETKILLRPPEKNKFFDSGGSNGACMLDDAKEQRLISVSELRTKLEQEKSKIESLKSFFGTVNFILGENSNNSSAASSSSATSNSMSSDEHTVQALMRLSEKKITEAEKRQKRIDDYEDEIKIFKDTRTAYDSEQTITRIINYYMNNLDLNAIFSIDDTDNPIKKEEIEYFMLNMHSRLDMCPYCSMYLSYSLGEWQKKLNEPKQSSLAASAAAASSGQSSSTTSAASAASATITTPEGKENYSISSNCK